MVGGFSGSKGGEGSAGGAQGSRDGIFTRTLKVPLPFFYLIECFRKFLLFRKFRVCAIYIRKGVVEMPRTNIGLTIPPEHEALLAHEAARAIEASEAQGEVRLRMQLSQAGQEITTIDMPPAAAALIHLLLKEMGEGKAVALVTDEPEITTQQAAELLHVSRPYVVGLVDKGHLAARSVGKQRRLLLKDVLAYKRAIETKRREALRELAALDQELGLR
jgi:excisionase family DNA binding protein